MEFGRLPHESASVKAVKKYVHSLLAKVKRTLTSSLKLTCLLCADHSEETILLADDASGVGTEVINVSSLAGH